MNKINCTGKRKILSVVFSCAVLIVCFCVLSCGLDDYYYLQEPLDLNCRTTPTDDYTKRYFSFLTRETGQNADYLSDDSEYTFLGTEVYYKIYNNLSDAQSVYSKVVTKNSNSSTASAAASYLIDDLGYKTFRLSTGYISPLVKATGNNRYVYIRLTSYGDESAFQHGICVSDSALEQYDSSSALEYEGTVVYPRRYINSNYGFDFDDSDSSNPVPASGDDDYQCSSTVTLSGTWYVALYAVSVGRDSSYTNAYSKATPLGIVSITKNTDN